MRNDFRLGATLLMTCLSLFAQNSSNQITYTYDLNGRRVPVSGVATAVGPGGASSSERTQIVDGRVLPLERSEEAVLSDTPSGRIVERTVRRYDSSGRPAGIEKVRVEEQRQPDGGLTVRTSVYRGDLNGRMDLAERSTLQSTKTSEGSISETVTERPGLSGSLTPVEKRRTVVRGDERRSEADSTVLLRDTNGAFSEASREITKTVTEGEAKRVEVAEYETATTGRMQLSGQRTSRSEKKPDGTEVTVTNVFGVVSQGRTVNGFNSGPGLREQQIVERTPAAGGGYVETYSIRRAELDAPRLGPTQRISETTCTGDCLKK